MCVGAKEGGLCVDVRQTYNVCVVAPILCSYDLLVGDIICTCNLE